ncbi:MAG: hypothetical protein SAL07_15550 [Oscillatoria sp. PMC 1051.18]|nr:hypothetical protein [Oscillatoria sp. PMC 1050.18]MEC5031313.1 hypothetical protein [Oscillatoria sp. PMC 1051.18]
MFVYRTSLFDNQVKERNLSDRVNRLCDDLESMTVDEVLAHFERLYPYLKRKEGNLRLIARIRRVGNDQILCWLAVFRRGDSKYEEFLREREKFSNPSLDGQIQHLEEWLRQQKASTKEMQPSPPPLDGNLLPWLDPPSWQKHTSDEVVIYESETWLNLFQTPEIQNQWQIYNRLIANLASNNDSIGESTGFDGIKIYTEKQHSLLFSKIITSDTPERKVLFLLAPFAKIPSPEEIQHIAQANQINCLSERLQIDDLTFSAKRAYPSYLLADEKSWLAIEKEEAANLALSAEEEAILHSVSTSNPSLPLFLNGQAGSGKSTMLFHLFADYCHRHWQYCQEEKRDFLSKPHPLFLAYNDRLLKVAQERVAALLASHHRFLERRGEEVEFPDISPFFQSLRTFLRDLLPPEERDRFLDANYISFHRFRQLCRRAWRGYSPERCWLVIRTFIKGYHLDERDVYLELEDYQEIPRRERTVSTEEFKKIYDHVWKWYKKRTEENNEWDDQDLIRKVLQLKCYNSEYTAIFCDEAQDFTQLELKLIMRLSVFSNYDLEHQHVESLPFAFAGDPLQTLNPTGFRWASLKAAFYNEVIAALSPTGRLGLEMNFTELECNYRSIPPIVGVNNLIQLWRRVLFDIPELKPQHTKKSGEFAPEKFILSQNIQPEDIVLYLQNTIIIIPCDEGGEIDYVQDDEILSRLVSGEENAEAPWNVLSAIAAKGLEFKQVVLYKFGEACDRKAWKTNDDRGEEIKYFFNKLYVAASRATERLFIIDTETGEHNLWKRASTEAELTQFIQQLPREREQKQWQERIKLISLGNSPAELGTDDLQAIAQTFETEGLQSQDPDWLRRAQRAYLKLDNYTQAVVCEAWALKLEAQYLEAGSRFLQLEEVEEAWNCFWEGMCWTELVNWYEEQEKQPNHQISTTRASVRPLINFMANNYEQSITRLQEFTTFLETEITNKKLAEHRFSQQWQNALQDYAQTISKLQLNKQLIPNEQWQRFGQVLLQLAQAGYQEDTLTAQAAECFYQSKNYAQAVESWEQIQATQTPEYNLAKSELVGMPTGLEYLAKISAYQRIILLWQQAGQPKETTWLNYVAPALEALNQYKNAFIIYTWLDLPSKVKTCWQKATDNQPEVKSLRALLHYYLGYRHWENAIATLETYLSTLKPAEQIALKFDFVYHLAASRLTPESLNTDLRLRYEEFMKQEIINSSTWQQYLLMEHLGITLEKIGSLVETLTFYEQYISHANTDLRLLARKRWLAVKSKQKDYFRNQGQINKAERINSEIARKAQNWGITLENLSLEAPLPPKQRPNPKVSFLVKTQTRKPQVETRQIRHLLIKIMKERGLILIKDLLSEEKIRISSASRQIQIGAVTVTAKESENLSFSVPTSGYNGVVIYNSKNVRLELEIAGEENKSIVEL